MKILQGIYSAYCMLTFILLFLIFFPLFLLFSFMGAKGRKIIWWILRLWALIWFPVIGMPVKRIYKASPDRRRRYIIVANHISYLDPTLLFGGIPFYSRPLAKIELARVPLFGILYRAVAVVIDRSSPQSRIQGIKILKNTLEQEHANIFLFPEGTFNETDQPLKSFYDGAFRIAAKTGTPILPVIFADTHRRMDYHSIWKWTPGRNRILFLPEIPVTEAYRANPRLLKEDTFKVMEQALIALRREHR